MATVDRFIQRKSKQLAFYVRGFLQNQITYSELDLFFWDTMEEWTQIKSGKQTPYERIEQVFWHVLHQVHYWPQKTLLEDEYLREELEMCLTFLEGKSEYLLPIDCIGIRP
ncbi:hypothetical protein [Paraglaciecola sp. L3A3]|uniref:hypothetical protein n=1 Tax=Paraglaciecola sp. L3A3 TaxID=2686358 RepID=UPI0018EECBA8|nr:hypothetical protein [Paraglaciecola sp. L3A3]